MILKKKKSYIIDHSNVTPSEKNIDHLTNQ